MQNDIFHIIASQYVTIWIRSSKHTLFLTLNQPRIVVVNFLTNQSHSCIIHRKTFFSLKIKLQLCVTFGEKVEVSYQSVGIFSCLPQNLAEDYLRCHSLKEFAAILVSLEHPPLEFDNDKGEFSAVLKSTPVSPVKESQVMVHLDTSQQNEHEVCTLTPLIP